MVNQPNEGLRRYIVDFSQKMNNKYVFESILIKFGKLSHNNYIFSHFGLQKSRVLPGSLDLCSQKVNYFSGPEY